MNHVSQSVKMKQLVQAVIDSESDEGCDGDLTVISKSAFKKLLNFHDRMVRENGYGDPSQDFLKKAKKA